MTWYEVLDVLPTARPNTIVAAYRRQARDIKPFTLAWERLQEAYKMGMRRAVNREWLNHG